MKQSSKIILLSLIAVMFVLPFVAAASLAMNNVLNTVFGTGVMDLEKSQMIAVMMIWVVIFVGISDLFIGLSPFSDWVSWIIGGALTITMANIGWVMAIFSWMTQLLAVAGAAAVYWVIGLTILAIFGNVWASGMLMAIKAKKEMMKTIKGADDVTAGIKGLKKINRALKSS
jgi:hypothetical protein